MRFPPEYMDRTIFLFNKGIAKFQFGGAFISEERAICGTLAHF